MADVKLMPMLGMNTAEEDAALMKRSREEGTRLFVRDAVNVDFTPEGKARLRRSARQVTSDGYRNLWQSPLHGDLFGSLNDAWGRIDRTAWTFEQLAVLGNGRVSHVVLNNLVCAAGPAGIVLYDGVAARRLTIDTPPPPLVLAADGALPAGRYGVAVAWLRGALESATSEVRQVDVSDNGALDITFPFCADQTVTAVRLYLTEQNGGELRRAGDYPVGGAANALMSVAPALGDLARFRHLSPMPTGDFLKYWRGRLVTARANVIRFSEAMAYHLHDERHGFVQMPQRVTFIEPVDGGLWVGQVDHVVFLEGTEPGGFSVSRKSSRAPVPFSAVQLHADEIDAEIAQGGAATVLWLAENGYVAGTASGAIIELQKRAMSGIAAKSGTSVVLDKRVFTAVS